VFGGIAGDSMARALVRDTAWREPDEQVLADALARARSAFAPGPAAAPDALEAMRERLFDAMWNDAGIVRDAAGLARAGAALGDIDAELRAWRLPPVAANPAFNLAWHDSLNLRNLVAVSQVIVQAATAREDSRGAHYRSDFPQPGELSTSTFTRVRSTGGGELAVEGVPVRFTRVRPGETLIETAGTSTS
jgi:fumarate reductase flavoprotein subunit